ncbi:transaldolase family protein [Streptomyces sp. NPDC055239]
MTTDPLRQLRAEGLSLWLDGVDGRLIENGTLDHAVDALGVTGVTCAPAGGDGDPGVLGSRQDRTAVGESAAYGAAPAEVARTVAARGARAVCAALLPVWSASRGAEGMACAPVGHTLDARAALAEARWLHWTVDRPNLLAGLPADPVGMATMSDCLAEGIGVAVGPVYSAEQYHQVLDAWLQGLERAHAAGLSLAGVPAAVHIPVSAIEEAARPLLAAHTGPAAQGLDRRIGIAVARLVFSAYEHVLDTPRWHDLVRAGARPHRLVWSVDTDQAARLAGGLIAEGTAQSLTAEGLRLLSGSVVPMEGDTLSGRTAAAHADLELLSDLGVEWPRRVQELGQDAPRHQNDAWHALVDEVAQAMEQAGRHPC